MYDDNSEDVREMRREALNLTIFPKGAGFKVSDPGSIHQDRILSFAAAMWQMTKGYETEKYCLGFWICPIEYKDYPCPLFYSESFFSNEYSGCHYYDQALHVMMESQGLDKKRMPIYVDVKLRAFCKKIGGFTIRGDIF